MLLAPLLGGCAATARVQISTADTLDTLTRSLEHALNEYHDEVRAADAERRRAAVDAFVHRIQTDHDDEQAAAAHVARFNEALDRLLGDAEVETARHHATLENVRVVAEAAAGLRRIGVRTLTLNDEVRRYLADRLQAAPDQPEEK